MSDPPLIQPVEELFPDVEASTIYEQIGETLGKYQRTLQSDRKHLLEQFTLVQAARKVVGVGSVGTAGPGSDPVYLGQSRLQRDMRLRRAKNIQIDGLPEDPAAEDPAAETPPQAGTAHHPQLPRHPVPPAAPGRPGARCRDLTPV
jgi:Uncharacterized protein conserved in bacteria (DUF2252)